LGDQTIAEPGYPPWQPGEEREVEDEHALRLNERSDFEIILPPPKKGHRSQ